jgi:hypothetical protein
MNRSCQPVSSSTGISVRSRAACICGIERIEGETVLSTHDITDASEVPEEMLATMANWTFPALQQAGVRYRWKGEETYGMLERSSPMEKIIR